MSRCSTVLREFMCYSQEKLADMIFTLDETREDLLMATKTENKKFIKEAYDEHVTISSEYLIDALEYSVKNFFVKYYQGDNKKSPRASIKVPSAENNLQVTSIIHTNSNQMSTKSIERDTILLRALSGDYFITNSLDKEVLTDDTFDNPRFGKKKLIKYRQDGDISEFDKVWNDKKIGIFNSTMVIPMAIRRKNLSPCSEHLIFQDHHELDRRVFGLLCIDHEDKDFFKDIDEAVDMGFIFADNLTQYMLIYYYNMFQSDVIKSTNAIMNKS